MNVHGKLICRACGIKSKSNEILALMCSLISFITNRLDHVAKELIPILLNGSSGSLWLVKNDEKSKEIPYSNEIF